MFGERRPTEMTMGSFIRLLAIATSLIVLAGFAFFAVDQMDEGSKTQRRALDTALGHPVSTDAVAPTPREEQAREAQHGQVREAVDDANDVLLAPFASLIDSSSSWVEHGVLALLALLLYGVGLGFLANLLPKPRARGSDWRAVQS
jgi:hypothetical protein